MCHTHRIVIDMLSLDEQSKNCQHVPVPEDEKNQTHKVIQLFYTYHYYQTISKIKLL